MQEETNKTIKENNMKKRPCDKCGKKFFEHEMIIVGKPKNRTPDKDLPPGIRRGDNKPVEKIYCKQCKESKWKQ